MAYGREKFASYIKKELAAFIERSVPHDPAAVISVTEVRLTQSLEMARVFISVFPDGMQSEIVRALKPYEVEARAYLGEKLKRRSVPKILFVADGAGVVKVRLEKLLDTVNDK